jgi:allophanate hydrolase subunit 2
MGFRLDGPKVTPAGGHDIVSDGIATGAIQLPGDGRPIVLLRDRQTTGGYPKIATVISADIGRFAQLQQGSAVRFTIVSRAEAIAAARAAADRIDGFAAAMTVANAILDAELLLSLNLIDGVTAGQ